MPTTTGVAPLDAAMAAKKRLAADRCDERAARLRSEAAALLERNRTHIVMADRKRPDDSDTKNSPTK